MSRAFPFGFLFALAACNRSSPTAQADASAVASDSGLSVGESYLVINDKTATATAYRVEERTPPRDGAIAEPRTAPTRCPAVGRLAIAATTETLRDVGLSLGGDGQRCYLQRDDSIGQFEARKVFEVPERSAAPHAALHARLEQLWRTHTWIPQRPANWLPQVGEHVVLLLGRELYPKTVLARRPGAVKISNERYDDWRSVQRLAPIPKPGTAPKDHVACSVETRDACLELLPPASVELPVTSLADADTLGRSILLDDLVMELGAVHAVIEQGGALVWIGPDGTPIARARSVFGFSVDEETANRLIHRAEEMTEASHATAFKKIGGVVRLLDEVRIVLPPANRPSLSSASARVLRDLEQGYIPKKPAAK